MNNSYLRRKEATKLLGIHYHTLYKLARKKEIETVKIGSRQLYSQKTNFGDSKICFFALLGANSNLRFSLKLEFEI